MFERVQSYLEKQANVWNHFENRVDTDYEIKTKTFFDKEQIHLYKVGAMGKGEPSWNFVTGVEIRDEKYYVHFFLDVEEEMIDSLEQAGYTYRSNAWLKEFTIEVATFDDVQTIYEQHVWRFDPGYFY